MIKTGILGVGGKDDPHKPDMRLLKGIACDVSRKNDEDYDMSVNSVDPEVLAELVIYARKQGWIN